MTQAAETRAGRSGWPGVALVGIGFVVTMLGTTLPTPIYPIYAARLGFGELVTTVVFSTYAVGVIAGLVLFGHWSDQIGRRPMVLAGLALSALSALVFLLPLSLTGLLVGRLVSGLSAGILTGTGTAYIVDLAPATQRARASLVAASLIMIGLGLGPLLAGVLVQLAPAPTRLVFVVDLVLVALSVGGVLLAHDPVRRIDAPRLRPRRLLVPQEARTAFVQAAIAGFAGFAVMGLFTAVAPAFLGQLLGMRSPAVLGLVVAAVLGSSVLGQVASQRLGLARALPTGCVLLVVGMVVFATGLATTSFVPLLVGGMVAGLGHGSAFRAGLGAVQARTPEEHRGAVTSTLFVALYVGISLPVIGEGALAASAGLQTAGLVFSGLVALLALVALLLLLRSRGVDRPR